jgi:serine/threonine protein kinase
LPSIYVESGVEEGAAYGFPPGDVVFIVGRAPNSGIVITDPLVSRQHCRVERINGRYRVVDLGSHNGTYLNDQRMPKKSTREISFGDVVRIGESELALREEAPDDEGELAGRRLGGYQLVKRIGSGGMGEVYRAVQVALGRQVAIKILSPELTEDRTFVDRFMTEARAAGKLNHPNVAQVHEVGESDGIYYYSMEYLAGGSVQERIRGGRALPLAEGVRIALGAARALEYAEKHGVIHCDIKPDNLMLTEEGEPRLTDLGIARTVKSMAEKVKQEGGVLGSPHYMAPEQARGEPIDHRVDIYALGATFYRMIAGRTPFTGKNAREIMEKQVYEEPPGLRSINPEIPQTVCRVITRMMKKKPEKRFQTARELIADLEKLLEEIAPEMEEDTVSRRQSRTMRRARRKRGSGMYAVLAVLVLLIAAGAGFALLTGPSGPSETQVQLWMGKGREAERDGQFEEARNWFLRIRKHLPKESPYHKQAVEAIKRLDLKIERQQAKASVDVHWGVVQEMRARAEKSKKPEEFKKLSEAYGRFAKKHPDCQHTATAKLAAKEFKQRYLKAAEADVRAFGAKAAELAKQCKFADLRAEWDLLAARYKGTRAGKLAEKRAAEAATLPRKALTDAEAAAKEALAAGKYDQVLKPFEKLLAADIGQLKAQAGTLIEEFKKKIADIEKEAKRKAELQKELAACNLIRDEAVKLANDYEYLRAKAKFVEAQLTYRRKGFDAEVEAARKLAADYWDERKIWTKLFDYSTAGRLGAAMTRLKDGLKAKIVEATSDGLTYSRGMGVRKRLAWKELPLKSVYDLLSRPKLSLDERVVLARFALKRRLFAEAKKQLEKVINADPKRKKELTPLLESAEKGAAAVPKPAPAAKPAPKPEKKD